MARKVWWLIGAVGFFLIAVPVFADDPSWPFPVGERINIREYADPYEDVSAPNGQGNVVVTDQSVWWVVYRWWAPDYWWRVTRYDLQTGAEEEFLFDYRIVQFVATADDADVFYITSDSPPCPGGSCLFHLDVSNGTSQLFLQFAPIWDPDLDGPWLIWRTNAHQSYIMNWQEGNEPSILDPDGDSPRISYPWVVWVEPVGADYRSVAHNLETEEEIITEPTYWQVGEVQANWAAVTSMMTCGTICKCSQALMARRGEIP